MSYTGNDRLFNSRCVCGSLRSSLVLSGSTDCGSGILPVSVSRTVMPVRYCAVGLIRYKTPRMPSDVSIRK